MANSNEHEAMSRLGEFAADMDEYRKEAGMDPPERDVPPPVHVITIDDGKFHIRRDYYAAYQIYRVQHDGREMALGHMRGYQSVKEAYDKLFEYQIQQRPLSHPMLDYMRNRIMRSTSIAEVNEAQEALKKEGIPLS